MRAPQRPVWSEGMFMAPQHLQALDRFHEDFLAGRVGGIAAHTWGVLDFELDAAALGAGQVKVQRFAGILADGTPVAFEESDPEAPVPRSAAEHFPPAARSVPVYLALAREREGVPSYSEPANAAAARTRYVIASRPVQDATAPAGALAPVAFGRLNCVLLFGGESHEDYEVLQVAELVRDQTGHFDVAERYVPPCLRISAAPWLRSELREVVARVIAKHRELAEGRRSRDASKADVAAADLNRMQQLQALSGALPVLAYYAEDGDASPREVYLALSQLAGVLSTFAAGSDPATLPKFAFTDLRSTFQPLFERLASLLGGMALAQHTVVPLEQRPGGLYVARLQDERLVQSPLFLAVTSLLPEKQVTEQLPKLCKIASSSEIQGLIQAASPGLSLEIVNRPPPQIPLREGTLYFALGNTGRYWQSIVTSKNMVIYLPPPFDAARNRLELLALVPPAGAAAKP
jgi:type VI secretion system protein ImpJ